MTLDSNDIKTKLLCLLLFNKVKIIFACIFQQLLRKLKKKTYRGIFMEDQLKLWIIYSIEIPYRTKWSFKMLNGPPWKFL